MKKSVVRASDDNMLIFAPPAEAPLALPVTLPPETAHALQRMFRDPRVLDKQQLGALIVDLHQAVALAPDVPEVRVLLGMALCVDLQIQDAMEEMRIAVNQDPDCFIARLKFGELLMRLRVCDQAAEHTQRAAELASNNVQSELARRQAAQLRTMMREGIERGGYGGFVSRVFRRKSNSRSTAPVLVGSE